MVTLDCPATFDGGGSFSSDSDVRWYFSFFSLAVDSFDCRNLFNIFFYLWWNNFKKSHTHTLLLRRPKIAAKELRRLPPFLFASLLLLPMSKPSPSELLLEAFAFFCIAGISENVGDGRFESEYFRKSVLADNVVKSWSRSMISEDGIERPPLSSSSSAISVGFDPMILKSFLERPLFGTCNIFVIFPSSFLVYFSLYDILFCLNCKKEHEYALNSRCLAFLSRTHFINARKISAMKEKVSCLSFFTRNITTTVVTTTTTTTTITAIITLNLFYDFALALAHERSFSNGNNYNVVALISIDHFHWEWLRDSHQLTKIVFILFFLSHSFGLLPSLFNFIKLSKIFESHML